MLIDNNFNNNNQPKEFTKPLGNHFENNQYINKNQQFQEQICQPKNIFVKDISSQQHVDPTNKSDMSDKSLAMLHERLEQGLISFEEFNKKCIELGKRREK